MPVKKVVEVKRGRGRPKGSTNKPKTSKTIGEQLFAKKAVPTERKLTLTFPIETANKIEQLANRRGIAISEMVRLALISLSRTYTVLGLKDAMGFGKYRDECVETIIRADPSYIRWVIENVDRVSFDTDAINLLWLVED